MRISFAVYGAIYLFVELVGRQLETIGWPNLSPLDVAAAVTDACLFVAVAAAVLVGLDVGGRHWHAAVVAARQERIRPAEEHWAAQEPIGVTSWRADAPALPAGPPATWQPAAPVGDYAGPPGSRPFPEQPGRLL